MSWPGERQRHAMSSRGISTAQRIAGPPSYSQKTVDNLSRKELAVEVRKILDEVLYEYVTSIEQDMLKTQNFLTDYDEYLKYKAEYGDYNDDWIVIPGVGKEPRMGALALFDIKPDWDEKKIKTEFKKRREAEPKSEPKDYFKDITQDLQVLTDQQLKSSHGEVGWTVNQIDKPKGSNVLLTLTYDGGAYDYFSYEADYGGGTLSKNLDKKLQERFGSNVIREDYTTWASQIYDVRGD